MTLPLEHCEHLYRFIWRELTDLDCKLLRIGGVQNHVHILIELNPNMALATLVQKIKSHSSGWLRRDGRFKDFAGWAREYYSATISASHKDAVVEYIKNQVQHHRGVSFDDEMQSICLSSGLTFDDRDMR